MKTWKATTIACRTVKSGRFASKGKCWMFKKTKLKKIPFGHLFR